jgi:uncharacterized protein YqjF (DUF2071 family)
MEVTASWFVVALRTLGLPYVRRHMSVDSTARAVRYRSQPIKPGDAGGHELIVRPRAPLVPPTGGSLEQFLTARCDAYHRVGRRLLRTTVEHAPWQLQAAPLERCDVGAMFDAAAMSSPSHPPLAHISPGVVVRLAPPVMLR